MEARHGRCLCGAVTFTAEVTSHDVVFCHCQTCRSWTSGPLMSVQHTGAVTFEGTENLGSYASSEFAERGFCKRCGSSLYWKRMDSSDYWLSAGALGGAANLKSGEQFYLGEKPSYYALAVDAGKAEHG